jgi:hypothetical protein
MARIVPSLPDQRSGRRASNPRPIRTLQAWFGHASVTTTEVYVHYASDPSGGVDLAQRAFEAVSAKNNCQITADEVADVA